MTQNILLFTTNAYFSDYGIYIIISN